MALTIDIGVEFNLFLRFQRIQVVIWRINFDKWRGVFKLVKIIFVSRFYLLGCGGGEMRLVLRQGMTLWGSVSSEMVRKACFIRESTAT